jgi:pimeloyl-ACP methyl ester carboxylesterase
VEAVGTNAMEDPRVQEEHGERRSVARVRRCARASQHADEMLVGTELQRLLLHDRPLTDAGVIHAMPHCCHDGNKSRLIVHPLKAIHFGPDDHRLFGTLHAPQRIRARSASVLLCNPFGEEALRAHRIYRVLATQLERSGYAVMRFDYGGTGDSMGDGADVTVESSVADVALAAEELRASSGAGKLVVIGLRLGATLAALATSRAGLRLRHLVMWDPIVDGSAYLSELAVMHRSYMRQEMGEMDWQDRLQVSPEGFPAEALGAPISAAFAAGLSAIDLATAELRSDYVTVVGTSDRASSARLRTRLPESPSARWLDLPSSAAWNSDAALNAAVVPMDVVQAVIARVEEVSP